HQGLICAWPNALYAAIPSEAAMIYNVPIDDHRTMLVYRTIFKGPAAEQTSIPYYYAPQVDLRKEPLALTYLLTQDIVCFAAQNADRTKEHLIEGDRGIILLRKRFFQELEVLERGGDPKAVLRDPAKNDRICLYATGPAAVSRVSNVTRFWLPYGIPENVQ